MSDDVTVSARGLPDDAPHSGGQLARRTGLNLVGIVTSNLARLAALAMVGHVGGAATLGNVQSAVSAANLAALAGPSSIGAAAGRYLPMSPDAAQGRAKQLLWQGNVLGLALAVVCGAALLPFFGPEVAAATVVLTAVLCSWVVGRGVMIARGTPLAPMLRVELVAAGALVVTMAALVWWDAPWPLYLIALAVLHLPLAVWAWAQHWSWPRAGSVGPGYRRYVGFAVVGTVASAGLVHLTHLVTNGLGGAEQAGYLAAGLLLLSPLGMVLVALNQVALPWLSRLLAQGREAEAEQRGRQLSAGLHFLVGTVLLALIPFGPQLGRWGFGDDMRLDYPLLIVLACATLAIAGRAGSVVLLSARGYAGVQRMAGLSYVGLAVALLAWGITYAVLGRVPAVYAGFGYGLGAAVVTVLITRVAYGSGAAGRAGLGMACWVLVAACITYAAAHPDPLWLALTVLALVVWVASTREGIRGLRAWARHVERRR